MSSAISSTGTQPYCVTFSYGTDYLSFVCSEKEGIEYQMEPYWSGFRDPIAFPVYTGSNGISTGTQYPAGYPTPSSTTSSSSSSTTTTSASGTSPGTSGSSATSNPSDHRGSSAPVGAIVGGVIGGLAFISLIAGAIIFFLMHRRRRPQPGQYQQPASGFPPGSQPPASQYPHPANPAMNTGFPSNASAPINPLPGQGPPQNPPTQQPPRHEIETEYNKPELDISRQQPEQTYLNQQPELPGMQPLQPETALP
ncbi:uncharacterized protein N7458_011924 [Penicillium daleae]|uniref:Mid2 domain-containing protein n=1 Tax=Penicillium daleae TaxID=63821 RepID=A0AAD6BUX2_9EURO|nr:uncharacterized protein N7458_011924 [Penicillium daleae]KAJ5432768.1 hypothetical protein N7458_011924 [Penicillium daleae]